MSSKYVSENQWSSSVEIQLAGSNCKEFPRVSAPWRNFPLSIKCDSGTQEISTNYLLIY